MISKKNSLLYAIISIVTVVSFILTPSTRANASTAVEMNNLRILTSFNAIIFGNYNVNSGESTGAIATRGDFNITGNVGYTITGTNRYPCLIAGGNLSKTPNAQLNLKGYLTTPVLSTTGTDLRNPSEQTSPPTRYNQQQLDSTFSRFQQPINSVMNKFTELFSNQALTTNEKFVQSPLSNRIKVANVNDVNDLLTGSTLNFPDLSNSDFLIIKCDAPNITLGASTAYNGQPIEPLNSSHKWLDSKILWVFPNATNITLNNMEFCGSILAPNATLHHNGGNIYGQLIAKNYEQTQSGDLHYSPLSWAKFLDESLNHQPQVVQQPISTPVTKDLKEQPVPDKTIPSTETQPLVSLQPSTETQPLVSLQPSTETQPLVPLQPSTETQPLVSLQPSTETQPLVPLQPSTETQPLVSLQPSTETQPLVSLQPSIVQQPISTPVTKDVKNQSVPDKTILKSDYKEPKLVNTTTSPLPKSNILTSVNKPVEQHKVTNVNPKTSDKGILTNILSIFLGLAGILFLKKK